MNVMTWTIAVAALCQASGCALVQADRENKKTEARINDKSSQLADEQATHDRLVAQTRQLQADLAGRQMDATQLRTQLDELAAMNQSMTAQTDALRQQRDALAQQLADLQKRARGLERDTTLPRDEKERQLAALKKKTQDVLNLLLRG